MSGQLIQIAVRALDRLAARLPWTKTKTRAGNERDPEHLRTGRQGEEDAYFWLRRQGYVVVARNWRAPGRRGEIDLIAWDHGVLCFIEVKTRTRRHLISAEAAVDVDKQRELRAVAREYQRRFPQTCSCRCDVVSVYGTPGHGTEFELSKNAFPLTEALPRRD